MGLAALAGGLVFAVSSSSLARSYEEPGYTVTSDHGDWQLRQYDVSIEARVTVEGPFDDALRRGFRVLAGYIFGGNRPAGGSVQAAEGESESIAMTVPVGAMPADGEGRWVVSFTMPDNYSLETLPEPLDQRVELVEVPGRRVAALRFPGSMRRSPERHEQALRRALDEAGLSAAGEPVYAQYNEPWIPGPLRRNEVLIPVQ